MSRQSEQYLLTNVLQRNAKVILDKTVVENDQLSNNSVALSREKILYIDLVRDLTEIAAIHLMLHYLIKIRTLGDGLIYSLLIVLGSLFVALLINCHRFCSLQRCTHNSGCPFTSPSCLSRDQRQTQTHPSCLQSGSFHSNAREVASLLSSAVNVRYQGSPPLDSASSIFDISHLDILTQYSPCAKD